MIIEVSICCDYLPTVALESVLRNDLQHVNSPFLSDDAIIHICDILCKRRPIADVKWKARKEEIWRAIQAKYLEAE